MASRQLVPRLNFREPVPYNEADEFFPGNPYGRVESRFYSGGHHNFEFTARENDQIQRAWVRGRERARLRWIDSNQPPHWPDYAYGPWTWSRWAREAELAERHRIRRRRAQHMLAAELVAWRHGGPGIASHILRRYRPRD